MRLFILVTILAYFLVACQKMPTLSAESTKPVNPDSPGSIPDGALQIILTTSTTAAQSMFSCTLISGTVYCWGDSGNQLTVSDIPEPIAVHGVTKLKVFDHSVAIVANVQRQPYRAYTGYQTAGVATYNFGPHNSGNITHIDYMPTVHWPDDSLLSPELQLYGQPFQASDDDQSENTTISYDWTGSQTTQGLMCKVIAGLINCPTFRASNGRDYPAFIISPVP